MLLETGAAVDTVDEDGMTALHKAAAAGSVEAVLLLLEAGAARDIINAHGMTALDIASGGVDDELVGLLMGTRRKKRRTS